MKLFVYDLLLHPPHSLKTVLCTLYILIGGSSIAFADVNTATVHSEMLRMPAKERLVYLRNACDNAIGKDDEKTIRSIEDLYCRGTKTGFNSR